MRQILMLKAAPMRSRQALVNSAGSPVLAFMLAAVAASPLAGCVGGVTETAAVAGPVGLQSSAPAASRRLAARAAGTASDATSASRVEAAQRALAGRSSDPRALAAFAAACMDRARATADPSWYARAESACAKAIAAQPGCYEPLRLRSWILAGQHRFAEAADAARSARAMRPLDPWNWGMLGDALAELGDYDGAAGAVQRMADLRPDTASYARVAYLRELFGDTEGAIEAMTLAEKSASPFDPELRAWCLAQLADLMLSRGDALRGGSYYRAALALSPSCPGALAGIARASTAVDRLEEAAALYARALETVPSLGLAAEYGDLLSRLGRENEARRQYDLVEAAGRLLAATTGLNDRQIALYRADHDRDPEGALAIAERELAGRKDIYGWDAVAWCALKAGRLDRARAAMGQALRLGTRDAKLHYHAGAIALASGDAPEARRCFRQALAINPHFDLLAAPKVRDALARLDRSGASPAVREVVGGAGPRIARIVRRSG